MRVQQDERPVTAADTRHDPASVVLRLGALPRRLGIAVFVCVGVLVAAGLVSDFLQFGVGLDPKSHAVSLIDLDQEANIPTWFSSVLLLVSASLLGVIAALAAAGRDRWRWHWMVLAVIFALFSLDEAAAIHERTIHPLREALDLSGPLQFAWVVPATVCVIVFAIVYARFVLALPHASRRRIVLAGAIFVAGALGMEMVGGAVASARGEDNLVYGLITTCEESLELTGVATFIYALLRHIAERWAEVRLRFGP